VKGKRTLVREVELLRAVSATHDSPLPLLLVEMRSAQENGW
jgi:hypothetical protein